MKRPPIEWYLQSVARCCGDKAGQRWCDIWSCGPIKSLCDYILALEREKAELLRLLCIAQDYLVQHLDPDSAPLDEIERVVKQAMKEQ